TIPHVPSPPPETLEGRVTSSPLGSCGPQPLANGVHEGADMPADSLNVKDFGAVGDGATDDHAAIAATITAVAASTAGRTIYFPPGRSLIAKPLAVNSPNVHLVGSPDDQSHLLAQFGSGPALLVASPRKQLAVRDSLVPGPGKAMSLGSGDFLFASDVSSMDLNGLAEFTV